MICFYHKSDFDGKCSAAIVLKKYPNCEVIGVDYEDSLSSMQISYKNEVVFVVDFCFSDDDMIKLNIESKELHLIDHHKSSIERLHKIGFLASGGQSLEIGKSGCELTWEYLFTNYRMPITVYLLGRYDVWDHEDCRVLPFQYGLRQISDTHPECNIWVELLCDDIERRSTSTKSVLANGSSLYEYQRSQDLYYMNSMSYVTEFEGLKAVVVNRAHLNSLAFDTKFKEGDQDLYIAFSIKPRKIKSTLLKMVYSLFGIRPIQVKYLLYSCKDTVDVSEIAVKYGGGGHRGAAGFHSKKLLV